MKSRLEEALGYEFKNKKLLDAALIHSSYANEKRIKTIHSNERLEFLGDSVLNMITAAYLFKECPDLPEGELTKIRAAAVCEQSLYEFALTISIGDFLLMGHGEEINGGRQRPSIMADATEAVIGASYLDGGVKAAEKIVLKVVKTRAKAAMEGKAFKDYKTALQEIVQQNPGEELHYVLASETGPDHNKKFEVEVCLNSNIIGRGEGRSKKEAEQMAAKKALELMGS